MIEFARRKYELVLADPPWQYNFSASRNRRIENHYPTMTVRQIMDLPLSDILADGAILFLWGTAPKLPEALAVMEAWGFEYKTNAVWDKLKIGMGYYFRGRHEHLLIGTRGAMPTPPPSERVSSVIRASRSRHSAKPVQVHELLERMYPEARKVELFARSHRPGWDAWGNEVDPTLVDL